MLACFLKWPEKTNNPIVKYVMNCETQIFFLKIGLDFWLAVRQPCLRLVNRALTTPPLRGDHEREISKRLNHTCKEIGLALGADKNTERPAPREIIAGQITSQKAD